MSKSLLRQLAHRSGNPPSIRERRSFVKEMVLAGLLGAELGCTSRRFVSAPKSIVIVGAGLAGLSCGFELSQAGHQVTIVEAKRRIGGRVFSSNGDKSIEFISGKNIEFGAELIGSNHPRWMHYAELFQLELQDVTEEIDLEMSVVLDGKRLTKSEANSLWEELEDTIDLLNLKASSVDAWEPWNSPQATQLDSQSVGAFIRMADLSGLAKKVLDLSLMSDNGQLTEQQSLLAMLAQIKGGGLERFWTESEVYRCRGGNDQLASALATRIGTENILLGKPVVEARTHDQGVGVILADGTELQADCLVITVSPKVWSKIAISPALPSVLKPQLGTNTKYFALVKDRFWASGPDPVSQYGLGNGLLQMTWEGTDNQSPDQLDQPAVVVGFSGGPSCQKLSSFSDQERDSALNDELDKFYPGFQNKFIKSTFMDWPTEPWTLASYSFPAPGQVTQQGPMLVSPLNDGRIYLAGEYTCHAFVGYMEGALQSGYRVAKQVVERFNEPAA
jgi:monoamine oxidase